MPRLTPEQLEARLHNVLREQPMRRAPETLQHRVLAEIARRQALPWWHRSYSYWPAAVQVTFLLLSAGVAVGAMTAAIAWFGGWSIDVGSWVEPVRNGWQTLRAAGVALVDVMAGWIPPIPTTWWYVLLLAAGCGYAALVGVGATAYRLLGHGR